MQQVGVVILAAGDGKRMKTGIPKVMNPLHGQPLVAHVVKSVEDAGFGLQPVVVVCANHTLVQDYLGTRASYAIQEKQLGTAHAVSCAESELQNKVGSVIVLYGDMPFISSDSLKHLAKIHEEYKDTLTLMTVTVSDFSDWRSQFADFGRIIRDEQGNILGIVEKKDAVAEQLAITEVNTSYFCFNAEWLWKNLKALRNDNVQKEYYLTDLVTLARAQGQRIGTVSIDPKEAIGINTKEHLEIAEAI